MRREQVLGLIPARGGSKGIPGKNTKYLAGKPLIAYTIEAAKECSCIDDVLVSTDSVDIAEVAREYGAWVPFLRPDELASDTAKTIDAVMYTVNRLTKEGREYDYVILLQPTSPLRKADDIEEAFLLARKTGEDVVSVSEVTDSPILIRTCERDGRLNPLLSGSSTVRRQDMPKYYRVNGSIYVNHVSKLSSGTSLNDNRIGYVMPKERSVDIDEMVDFLVAENYLAEENKNTKRGIIDEKTI